MIKCGSLHKVDLKYPRWHKNTHSRQMKNPLHSFIAIYIYVGARLYKCTISSVLKKESPSIEEVVCGNITSISTSKQVNKHSFFHILALT